MQLLHKLKVRVENYVSRVKITFKRALYLAGQTKFLNHYDLRMYCLNDLNSQPICSKQYAHEIQIRKFPKEVNQVLVSWQKFPKSSNSWLDKDDIVDKLFYNAKDICSSL
ncbi:hypothetical protein PR048_015979 [Dryococelus australis]|uniref:Chromo domain-containing protein n=1 Tax=Dryococelus australis TaxID=614101 RepID=A0ABQ9HIP2_9NEOP|nr:hypothetical protein PR048_015979 [Dryococelus australis]